MMPIDAASGRVKPNASASSSVRKIPNWPAAPSSTIRGFSSSGPKSVSAPMPMKISSGKSSLRMPMSYSTRSMPSSAMSGDSGRLASMQPAPMGTSSSGS